MNEELAQAVGQRVRRLRQRDGLSVRRQAALVGVSPSALSTLENGHGGMSLGTLQQVANHFGLSITELLAPLPETETSTNDGAPPLEVFPASVSTTRAVKRGVGSLYKLLGSGAGHLLQPYVISFLPGGGYERDAMGHAGEEFTYVVLGEVELLIGDEAHHLRQGDAIRFRAETPHSFRNASASGIALIVGAATPPW
jgi:transcriptional regulator with XRE-family HTH domain